MLYYAFIIVMLLDVSCHSHYHSMRLQKNIHIQIGDMGLTIYFLYLVTAMILDIIY